MKYWGILLREIIQRKSVRKFIGLREHMKPTSPKMIFKVLFFLQLFFSPFSLFDQAFNRKNIWDKIDKTPTFNGVTPHVTILTVLKAIRTSQDGILDEVLGGIISEFRNRGTFGRFSEERIQ